MGEYTHTHIYIYIYAYLCIYIYIDLINETECIMYQIYVKCDISKNINNCYCDNNDNEICAN